MDKTEHRAKISKIAELKEGTIFPEGMEAACRQLIECLNGSKNSYTVRVFRYAESEEYRAEIGINELTSMFAVRGDSDGG